MWRSQAGRTATIGIAIALFIVCSVLPVAYLLVKMLSGASNIYGAMLLDARQRGLLFNTAALGAGTALLATAIGAPLGFVLARIPLPQKALLRLALAAPALMPPYVMALAWVYLAGNLSSVLSDGNLASNPIHSLPAAVLVLGIVFYPMAMLASEVAVRRLDGRLEEAALMVASPSRVLWRITFRLAAPSILAGALVIFVLAVSEFGVPGLLRVRVYTTEVFTAFAALYDFSRALVITVPLLLLCIIAAVIAGALLQGRLVVGRRNTSTRPMLFDAWRRPGATFAFVVIGTTLGLPILILLREAMNVRSLASVLGGSGASIGNSLVLATTGATAVVSVAVWLGYARARARSRVGAIADVLFVLLFAVPSTVVGVGLIGLWNRPGPLGIAYGTNVMLLLAYLARFLPVAALMLAASARYIPVSQEEAAAVSGAGWTHTMTRIVLPQMRLGLAAAWVVAFVLAFGELGASILVVPPGEATLPIRIYTMVANTPSSNIAVFALLQTLVILTPLAVLGAVASLRPQDVP